MTSARILDYMASSSGPLATGRALPNVKHRARYKWLRDNPGEWLQWGPYPGADRIGVHGTAGRWFRNHYPHLRIECRQNGEFLEVRTVRRTND